MTPVKSGEDQSAGVVIFGALNSNSAEQVDPPRLITADSAS
jgi:hypothetical protein